MRTCLSCRAALREFRAAPERIAGAVAPVALVADGGTSGIRGFAESLLGAAQGKAAAAGDRLQATAELATGQKVAAVAASAAALAGGGTAIDEFANHQGPPRPAPVEQAAPAEPVKEEVPVEAVPAPPAPVEAPSAEQAPTPTQEPLAAESAPPPPPPDPANEFDPTGAAAPAEPAPTGAPPPQGTGVAPAARGGGGSSGAGEFAP
jgi:hypothetical protein